MDITAQTLVLIPRLGTVTLVELEKDSKHGDGSGRAQEGRHDSDQSPLFAGLEGQGLERSVHVRHVASGHYVAHHVGVGSPSSEGCR